jgi:predicted DCC family thiol-disulfide oxidoreductase YuxK
MNHPILLYDGVCYFCNGLVRFALRQDKGRRLRFASLQSAAGQALLREHGFTDGEIDSAVLIENGRIYTRSTCALRALRYLRFPWPLLYGLILVPPFMRDAIYDYVARNRYHWFGRMETCPLPPPEQREQFLT